MIFVGCGAQCVMFQLSLELLNSKFFGQSYDQLTETAPNTLKLCTVLFQHYFRGRVVVIGFCTVSESLLGLLKLFI